VTAVFLPDGPAARLCAEIAQRQAMEPRTYSINGTKRQRMQRSKELAMDLAVHWQREIEALDAKEASRG
jgi:hypothetical protein